MISKETYRNLVLAGCNLVKDIIERNKLIKECSEQEIDMPEEIFDFLDTSPHTSEAFDSLVWVAGEMNFGVEHPHDFLRCMYADIVSVFTFDDPLAERLFELGYEVCTTNSVPEELAELYNKVSPDIIYWVRRNL